MRRQPRNVAALLFIALALVGCSPSKPTGSGAAGPAPAALPDQPKVAADLQVIGPSFSIVPEFAPNPRIRSDEHRPPEANGLEFSQDGSRLLIRSRGAKNGVQVWTVGDPPTRVRAWDATTGALSPDGRQVVYESPSHGTGVVVDVDSNRMLSVLNSVGGTDLAFGPPNLVICLWTNWNGKTSDRCTIQTAEATTGARRSEIVVHEGEGAGQVRRSKPFDEGRKVAVVHGRDPMVDVWDLATQRRVRQVKFPFEHPAGQAAPYVNPTGTRMASGAPSGARLAGADVGTSLIFWDGESGEPMAVIPQAGGVYHADFVPGRDLFLMASNALREEKRQASPEVAAYDITTKAYTAVFRGGHTGYITALAVAPNGRWLATGDKDGRVQLWDLRQLRLSTLPGRRLAAGDRDQKRHRPCLGLAFPRVAARRRRCDV